MISIEGIEYLTAAEAAAMLGVKINTLYAYASRGRLLSYRRGIKRERFYRRDEVEALLKMRPASGRDKSSTSSPEDFWLS